MDKFAIAKQVIEMLDGVDRFCFTKNQAQDLAKAVINAVSIL